LFNFKTVAKGVLDALKEFFGEIVHVVIDEVKTNDPHYTVLPHRDSLDKLHYKHRIRRLRTNI